MRIGIVCPYAFDVPGGVQFHVRDLAEFFLAEGHEVRVLAPVDDPDAELPAYVTSCGRAVPVRYNGSVARLTFGPVTSSRVSRWLEDGDFDVLHLHEPITPSASLMALWASTEPVVATFHTSNLRSRAMHAANPLLRPSTEKIRARIAVSEEARRTVRRHLGGDAYIIPNGVDTSRFRPDGATTRWSGTPARPVLAFLGRIDEPRKGLAVILAAMPGILDALPGVRLVVAGPGDVEEISAGLDPRVRAATEFLGAVSEDDKVALLRSADLYVAPHTGGESFGIVLVEAMAAGAPVLASDLEAFTAVLGDGPAGRTFPNGDSAALGEAVVGLVGDPEERARLRELGLRRARSFDWNVVAQRVMAVYETVIEGADHSPVESALRSGLLGRLRWPTRGEA
ncbi:GDP-mannose-dependent alpha-(1-2)-phosphatidylinositol mannosyltransferase [Knoellia flava TL1]|uniref:D-inositol 3-phosphate glycosyltransferase n=2 Tax=Knoellia flava TaxID=913969 RepID=A0A8H9KQJ5_9MICO|nr:glycosyltransferase family 4 protein [Knoellia flava]KGN32016.1 GDP-mannose-dependent alpha-(1-2)-phosphatidylinositol mannosyltransferase [Knoellia flava TL1]GGB65703.1 GDP-mannose-dependent alpha-(1-2)-phosphatidylinositol mannosyltransferase [Knoellia flava]